MIQKTITCPRCGEKIELSQAISRDIEATIKKQYENEIQKIEENSQKKIKEKEDEMKELFEIEKKKIEERAKELTEKSLKIELTDLKEQLSDKTNKLEEARDHELQLRKRQRELEDREKALELEMARKLDKERKNLIEEISIEFEEKHRLKDAEKVKQLADMKKQIDDLKRKAELGSQQTKGEVLEIELEGRLKNEFQFDEIEPVAIGVKGGDVVQIVKTQSGQICGKILWETKRTKSWSDSWIQKLKDDQRAAKADIAVLVSEALPKGLNQFRQIKGVWVSDIWKW